MDEKSKRHTHSDEPEENIPEEDIVPDEEDGGESLLKDSIKKLRAQLRDCNAQKQEYLDGWQRAKADFINARRAEDLRRQEVVTYAQEGVLAELLPVIDSFDLAFADKGAWEKMDENWRRGIEHIYTQFLSILAGQHFIPFAPLGESFDPLAHESVGLTDVTKEDQDQKVVEVVQKGYQLNGKIIRPAKVKVGRFNKKS
jgi:molecular chaperone GrpE (heat shock protein)